MQRKTHWEYLAEQVEGLASHAILDIGSGKGIFLLEAAEHGAVATGLEVSEAYIAIARERLNTAGYEASIVRGVAEKLPFPDASFDFANIGEVIEHVEDPRQMLVEAHRILLKGGRAYLSVPNRFGLRDQHYHLYFVNWLPRFLSDSFISVFGMHKDYADKSVGRQRLADMHYYTYGAVTCLAREAGFSVVDMRVKRIETEAAGLARLLARAIYPLARFWYFDSFHLLLTKEE